MFIIIWSYLLTPELIHIVTGMKTPTQQYEQNNHVPNKYEVFFP